jgi:hypothetical protein
VSPRPPVDAWGVGALTQDEEHPQELLDDQAEEKGRRDGHSPECDGDQPQDSQPPGQAVQLLLPNGAAQGDDLRGETREWGQDSSGAHNDVSEEMGRECTPSFECPATSIIEERHKVLMRRWH